MGAAGGFTAAALLFAALPVRAEAPPPGATACSGCHAPPPLATAIPPIQGRPAEEIVSAVLAFRSGERPATVMDRIAKGFSEDEIRAIAGWIGAQK